MPQRAQYAFEQLVLHGPSIAGGERVGPSSTRSKPRCMYSSRLERFSLVQSCSRIAGCFAEMS